MDVELEDREKLSDRDYQEQAAFRTALRAFLSLSEQHAREAGITPQQYLLLLVVRGHPAYPRVGMRGLTGALRLRQPAVSLLVERSVQRGLLRREENPDDRRATVISLTETGQQLLDRIMLANRQALGSHEGPLLWDTLRATLHRQAESTSYES